MKKSSVTLTLGQIAAGSVVGLLGGWICLLVFENFIWEVLLGDRVRHGFWVGLLLLISLSVWYATVIIGASQGIRFVSQKFGINIRLKPLCSGAFLGPPAVVGLLALLNVPWEIFGRPNLILALILPLLKALAYVISLPMRGWVSLGLPVEIWYILAVPIGAILGYRLAAAENTEVSAEHG
ncbi:hypothetical protein C6496_13290 [Candidatus Poribacteria bacterium]|nr:MAG: hypothetical protein C6496_13290 [Candidatus Poribacteria bacterium]